jgi:hypothetical protein
MAPRQTISINDPVFEPVQVLLSESYTRHAPVLINAPDNVRREVQMHIDRGTVVPPDARIGRVKNAIVIKRGILVDIEYRIIAESLINMDDRQRFEDEVGSAYDAACSASAELPSLPDTGGPFVMLKQTWDGNYGHWLMESLPRLEIVAAQHRLAELRFIVSDNASSNMRAVYADSLAMMNVARDQILFLPDETYRVADIIYPTPMTIQPWVKSPAVIRILEGLRQYAEPQIAAAEKLFVSRNAWGNRRLLNESAVLEALDSRGYALIRPETLSFAQQIAAFSRARLVVGTLGAALTNIVFAPTGVRLLALTSERMVDDFYWDLLSLKDGTYTSIHGRASEPERGMHSDFSIDIPCLKQLLGAFEAG